MVDWSSWTARRHAHRDRHADDNACASNQPVLRAPDSPASTGSMTFADRSYSCGKCSSANGNEYRDHTTRAYPAESAQSTKSFRLFLDRTSSVRLAMDFHRSRCCRALPRFPLIEKSAFRGFGGNPETLVHNCLTCTPPFEWIGAMTRVHRMRNAAAFSQVDRTADCKIRVAGIVCR